MAKNLRLVTFLPVAAAIAFSLVPAPADITPFTVLHHYVTPLSEPGCQPESTLVETSPGVFYGTTTNCSPTIFSVTSGGVYTTVASINTNSIPRGALLHASNGLLYGVTAGGDIFRSDLAGNVTYLATGYGISGIGFPLIEDETRSLYGIVGDGNSFNIFLFRMTLSGAMTTIHQFTAAEGYPTGGVFKHSDTNLYGATTVGIYRVSTVNGRFTMIHRFAAGNIPYATLTQGIHGKLYGVIQGHPNAVYSLNPDGTGYATVDVGTDGYAGMSTGLTLGSNGLLYGGTNLDGAGGGRLYVFKPPAGLRTFVTWPKRQFNGPVTPSGGVTISSDGQLYGTLSSAGTGAIDLGGIYSMNVGLRPPPPEIDAFAPAFGPVGTSVLLSGSHFLRATAVRFNGTDAAFAATTDGFITATVPAGATSGAIEVTTSNGSAASALPFTVQ